MQYTCVKNREVNKVSILKWVPFETLLFSAGIALSEFPPYRADFHKRIKTRQNYLFP